MPSSLEPAPFYQLGDRVTVNYAQADRVFVVVGVRRHPMELNQPFSHHVVFATLDKAAVQIHVKEEHLQHLQGTGEDLEKWQARQRAADIEAKKKKKK
jgi:hypothetical protein